MKRILLAMLLSSPTAAFGQGYVLFENDAGSSSNIGVCTNQLSNSTVAQGGTYTVALFWYNGRYFQQIAVFTPPNFGRGYDGFSMRVPL
jgi:hypothetical protein